MEKQVYEALGHFSKGFQVLTEAFKAAGIGNDPRVETQDPVTTAKTTTERARKAADKAKPAPKVEPEVEETQTEEPAAPVEEKKAAPKTKAKKADEPDYETLDRDQKIEHLRSRMVLVAQKNGGDRDKTYSYLKKYKATKVHELSDDNLDNLKNDIEVFLGGPDALDI
jgi:hypothetical protein